MHSRKCAKAYNTRAQSPLQLSVTRALQPGRAAGGGCVTVPENWIPSPRGRREAAAGGGGRACVNFNRHLIGHLSGAATLHGASSAPLNRDQVDLHGEDNAERRSLGSAPLAHCSFVRGRRGRAPASCQETDSAAISPPSIGGGLIPPPRPAANKEPRGSSGAPRRGLMAGARDCARGPIDECLLH